MTGPVLTRPAEADVLPEHDCPTCGAKPKEWCLFKGGRDPGVQHVDRPRSTWEVETWRT